MSTRTPLIVVTLPGRTAREVRAQAEVARDAGADLAEVRFDRWDPADLSGAKDLFPAPLPFVATLRSRIEGGAGPDAPQERGAILTALARLPFRWIDLEEQRDEPTVPRLPPAASLGRIVSTHFPAGTPASEVARRMAGVAPLGSIRKLVLPASVGEFFRDILPLLPGIADRETILLTTGPSGGLLRAWSRRWGYPLVFASLPESSRAADAPVVEPSQVPVDRLRHFFSGEERASLFAVVGHPIAHSRSPALHSRWMREAGVPGIYLSLDIESEAELVEALGPLSEGGFRGINVTHPWKSAAFEAATRLGPGAEACGAANCLTFRDGEVEAENTDLAAILRRLEELRGLGEWDGSELAVVGTGGAAAASLAASREAKVSATIFARDARRAAFLSERFGAAVGVRPEARPFSLVIHATDVGRADAGALEVPLAELIGPGSRVLDWVYSPEDPTIRSISERAGGRYEDGWRLLVYQAAASFGIWWGEEPAAELVDSAIAGGPCAA